MKVIEVSSFGAPDVLRLADRPAPVFGTGEVLIQVAASGINRPDVLQRGGYYPAPPGASDILGLEVAGVIVDGDASAMRDMSQRINSSRNRCALHLWASVCRFPPD